MKVGSWNVRTLLDRKESSYPECQSGMIMKQLGWYINIAALCEIRLNGEGHLTDSGVSYAYFWKGHPKDKKNESGVSLAIRTELSNCKALVIESFFLYLVIVI